MAKSGLASRRKAETYIKEGRIQINGKVAKLPDQVETGDTVLFDGQKVVLSEKRYFLVYKPIGFISTVDDPHAKKKVVDLVDVPGLFPVGRLDKDSEGLMILTNDGEMAQELTHPSFAHEKEYFVWVSLPQKDQSLRLENALKFFKCGIKLDNKKTQPAAIKLIAKAGGEAKFNIVLREGMKRQIRRTFEKAGLNVKKLQRVRMGEFRLGDLEPGESNEINIPSKGK